MRVLVYFRWPWPFRLTASSSERSRSSPADSSPGKYWDLERLLRNFDNGFTEALYFCQPLEWFGQEWSFPKRSALYGQQTSELSEKAVRGPLLTLFTGG